MIREIIQFLKRVMGIGKSSSEERSEPEGKTGKKKLDIIKKKIENYFPCDQCLLFPSCTKLCDKLEYDNDTLIVFKGGYFRCPDCGHDYYYEGPSGGLSTNIKCCRCGHRFNTTPFGAERIGL